MIDLEDKQFKVHNWIVLFIVCAVTFFVNNKVLLPDIMESRNIISAREMVYEGHWLVPTMNGYLRLEKPPLPTWLTALAEIASPDNLGLQRSMAGLAAVLLVLAFFLIGKKIFRDEGTALLSSLILCTCYNVVLMGRTASWDIYTHAFMLMGIYFLINAFEKEKCSWKDFILSGVFTGLSIMSKGPVSLFALLLPFLIAYCWFYPPKMQGKWKGLAAMAVTSLAIGCWWYAYIYVFNGDAMSSVAAKESDNWSSHNVRPWYYYWAFFLEAGVWAVLLLSAIFVPIWSWREREAKEYKFPILWMFLTLIILSIPGEKKTRYLLPLMISACYAMGYLINAWKCRFLRRQAHKADKIVFRVNAWLLSAVTLLLPAAMFVFAYKPGFLAIGQYAAMSAICIGTSVFLGYCAIGLKPSGLVGAVAILFLSAEILAMPALKGIVNNPKMHSIEQTRNMEVLKGIPFYYDSKDELRIEEVYAAHRNIHPIDCSSTDSLRKALPFAILTHNSVASELPKGIFDYADTLHIDRYDNNNHPEGNRLHRPIFIYNLTLLTPKASKADSVSKRIQALPRSLSK